MSAAALAALLDTLAIEAPDEVARGRAALERALAWTGTTAWGEVAWIFSDLACGAPVELVWRPGRPGLFWTAEPAAPEWPTPRRVVRALALARLMGARFDRRAVALVRAALATSDAPWPIWLGGRHDSSGDAAKLYALTGPAAPLDPALAGVAALLRPECRVVMLGLSSDGGRELYWRQPSREPGDRWRLARDAKIAPLAANLDSALIDWTGHGLDAENGGRFGLSVKLSPAGEPEALSAFLRVAQAGGESRVRARLLAAGGDANPALAALWADGRLRPMGLTLAATADAVVPAIGLRVTG